MMHSQRFWGAVVGGCALLAAQAPASRAADDAELDVTHVALFSSGVGYFEAEAEVSGNANARLNFRTEQINDILKSLVVQDFGGGRVGVVSYASQAPLERTLRSFAVDITGNPPLLGLLEQLRGEPVTITGAREISGMIVGVEKLTIREEDQTRVVGVVNVLTDAGIEQVRLDELRDIRFKNDRVNDELRKALTTLAGAKDTDKKSVELRFDGAGTRRVRAAYLLEAPVWKTSYRLVLNDEDEPFLQGWAIVENATEEDWNDVRLSLVSGRPISFVMDLYTPLYVPRPEEQLELYASLRAPEFEEGVASSSPMRRGRSSSLAAKAIPPSPQPTAGEDFAGGRAFRALAEAYDGDPNNDPRLGIGLAGQGVQSLADAADAGELFQYTIATPVSIPRQHSAMLPVVNEAVTADKVSIYNPATHPKHPLNGLELENTTDLHLMQGPITLFDSDVYAGDAKLPDMQPGEKRLVAYALDLATTVDIKQNPRPMASVSLKVVKGVLHHERKHFDERTYVIRNKADRPREVIVEQPYGDDWKLIEPDKPYERTSSISRFKVEVPALETRELLVKLERTLEERIALLDRNVDYLQVLLRNRELSPALRNALQRLVQMRTELGSLERQRLQAERDMNEYVQDQARVRENLRTLRQGSDTYDRQMRKFDELETSIENQRERVENAREQFEEKQSTLERFVAGLTVE